MSDSGIAEALAAIARALDRIADALTAAGGSGKPVSIAELPLSLRTFHVLEDHHIHTIDELITRSERELGRLHNLGRRGVNEIVDLLAQRGLRLRDD